MTFVFKIGVFQTYNIIFTIKNKRPTGIKGHQSIRDSAMSDLLQKGSYLHITAHHRINKNQQLHRKSAL